MNLHNHVARPGETPQDAAKIFEQLEEADEIGTLTQGDMTTLANFGLAAVVIMVFTIGFILGAIIY